MTGKIDGVIEAVRTKNGQILLARSYERRGAAFSDRIMLDRKSLVERLRAGKIFVVGERVVLHGGTFIFGAKVNLVKRGGQEWISTHPDASRDEIESAPVF
ncbi:MAG: hypothetical protein FJZ87_09795 [Chloroflexi bacterium]|nr:hypothetical protein [Chloroflexota bacterium]